MRPRWGAATVVAACLVLTGCTPTVALDPAPHATSVGCAGVVVRLPEAIGAFDRRSTDAQGTAAWGDPAVITLRCGVEEPLVAGDCGTYEGVDWLHRAVRVGSSELYAIDTYGRDPVVEVVYDQRRGANSSDIIQALSRDVVAAATRPTGARCRSSDDLASPTPTATGS